MYKSFRFRIYPNQNQREQLTANFSVCQRFYNQLVERHAEGSEVNAVQKRLIIEQYVQEQPQLAAFNQTMLYYAVDNFNWSLRRSRELNRRLRFRSARGRVTFCLSNCRKTINISPRSLDIQPVGQLRASQSERMQGEIINVTIIKAASGRYYASVLTRQSEKPVLPVTLKEKVHCIGIDMGIKHFLTQSDGIQVANPRYFEADLDRLARMQKTLEKKEKNSSNYRKLQLRIARQHERIVNRRNAFLHRESCRIIKNYDIIAVETLSVAGLLQQKKLSLQIADASWSKFISMLEYKARWYGKKLVKIDRYYPSSKTCCKCSYQLDEISLSIREWDCPICETQHDRDTNAAINIMIQGVKTYMKENPAIEKRQKLIPVLSNLR